MNIMIAEDDAVIRQELRVLLENALYQVTALEDFSDVASAVLAEKPDLVFMDITMPNKDGLETLKEIKAMDPGATIVMCSAMGQETMVMDSIKSGAKDFIVKPFKPERVLSTVKKILG